MCWDTPPAPWLVLVSPLCGWDLGVVNGYEYLCIHKTWPQMMNVALGTIE